MSSLDMVAYINATREAGKAELLHKSFLAKVPSVLGYTDSAKYFAQYKDSTGRSLPCYNFPRREAMLLAMSYSYKLQATVYPCRVVRRMVGSRGHHSPATARSHPSWHQTSPTHSRRLLAPLLSLPDMRPAWHTADVADLADPAPMGTTPTGTPLKL